MLIWAYCCFRKYGLLISEVLPSAFSQAWRLYLENADSDRRQKQVCLAESITLSRSLDRTYLYQFYVFMLSACLMTDWNKKSGCQHNADSRLTFIDINNYEYLKICPGRMRIFFVMWLSLQSSSIVVLRFFAMLDRVSPRLTL